MVLNAAVQMLREAEELKETILKFKSGTSMLQDRNIWSTQQQLQKVYQKVLILDLDYALEKKVEQDLWNVGFKQQIEALQAISKDRKNPARSEGQAMLSWVLQAAAGFYLCLLHQICTTFKLDLPFRRRASLIGCVEGWSAGGCGGLAGARLPAAGAARYIAQHCLVHLGDLARYRQQLALAHTFYRHALVVSAHSGQPYNQLALVAWRRGRRLAALYWHARSLLVRAPFPPAPANLARTLAAAAAASDNALHNDTKPAPVLPGITSTARASARVDVAAGSARVLDSHSYVSAFIRALHLVHTQDDLDEATKLVDTLNSSLTALIATESFESMTLIKMAVLTMWLVSSTEALGAGALAAGELAAARLALALAAGALTALLLPAYTWRSVPPAVQPAIKVWLQWAVSHPDALQSSAFVARPQLWPALALTLNKLVDTADNFKGDLYATVPLPEDEELVGFLPLEGGTVGLRFAAHALWDTYGDRVPDTEDRDSDSSDADSCGGEVSRADVLSSPGVEHRLRAHRLLQLGLRLAALRPEMLTATEEDGKTRFVATSLGGEELQRALAELSLGAPTGEDTSAPPSEGEGETAPQPPPPPLVISEADFREKVREKRVGILKPQGSLERAREERALASCTQDDQLGDQDAAMLEECLKNEEEKKEAARKPRMNVAMAAIMRKQEETNKQVKFVTPPLTPDVTAEKSEITKESEKAKIAQPKVMKSLTNLPIGRKTGGILSLKDKSAGYPHLVNTDPEPAKKSEKDDKKEFKSSQVSQSSQQYGPTKPHEVVTSSGWGNMGGPQPSGYSEPPRFNVPPPYGVPAGPGLHLGQGLGLHTMGLGLQSLHTQGLHTPGPHTSGLNTSGLHAPGLRLPVVNPKEIDVRSAALQKQNSRPDFHQDNVNKFGNQNYQMSGDKKNFLNDLPPRFANQYRHWQMQDNQFTNQENKFRDDGYQQGSSLFGGMSGVGGRWAPWWPADGQSQFTAGCPPGQMQGPPAGYYGGHVGPASGTYGPPVRAPDPSYSPAPGGGARDPSLYPQFANFQPPPERRANNNYEQFKAEGGGNTYSLFSGAADVPAWGLPHQHQSLWSGPGPSPLERLLEQQRHMKQEPQ